MTHIVYGIDEKFLPCLLVSMYSAMTTVTGPAKITIVVTGREFDVSDIYSLVESFPNVSLEILELTSESLNKYELATKSTRYSSATMVPLFIPSLIDEKCLFLDADSLVLQDVSSLFELDLEDCLIGAVLGYTRAVFKEVINSSDITDIFFRSWKKRQKKLLEKNINTMKFTEQELVTKYFSTGVILFNSSKINECGLSKRLINLEQSKQYWNSSPDEEYFNMFFKDRVYYIDVKWNVYKDFPFWMQKYFPDFIKTEIISAMKSPGILHYANFFRKRPWDRPWYRTRNRYKTYSRFCQDMQSKTGLDLISMFNARV